MIYKSYFLNFYKFFTISIDIIIEIVILIYLLLVRKYIEHEIIGAIFIIVLFFLLLKNVIFYGISFLDRRFFNICLKHNIDARLFPLFGILNCIMYMVLINIIPEVSLFPLFGILKYIMVALLINVSPDVIQ